MRSDSSDSITMTLRNLVETDGTLMAIGAYDAITAKLAQQAGAKAIYMSGSCVATSVTGGPDIGMTTMTEMANRAHQISGAIDVPLIADGDTGYGNSLNVRRTVREYERAGVNAIQLEDQTFPKRCGHFDGKDIVPASEFAEKVDAATAARRDDEFLVIARTDALAVEGIEEAVDRANLYREAGADILFVESPTSREQMNQVIGEVPGFHLANMAAKGKTPHLPVAELEDIGYDLAIFPSDAFKAGLKTFREVYETLINERTQKPVLDQMMEWETRDEVTDLAEIEAFEQQHAQNRAEYKAQYEDE